jgi:bacteriorhodopsin
MNTKSSFYNSLILSIVVQVVTGIIDTIALFANSAVPVLSQLLLLEFIVQIIESLFYIWLFLNFNQETNVTPKRYIDWAITTPTMLVELIIYLIYLKDKENEIDVKKLNLFNLLIENSSTISYVIFLNWLMLIFGYLGEVKILDTLTGVLLGFVPFLIYYFIIYVKYAIKSQTGWKLFWYFFIFWSLYGVVALLPYYIKNALYNILDLFAKNFFGLFLSYIILTGSY